ncbi:MAG: rRNA maturation RNase YbeY [Thermodesulfovibrionales bacterium]|jgi:probable rRNA maturation factor
MVVIRNHQRIIKIDLQKFKKDSRELLRSYSLQRVELGILLVDDRRMKELNCRYRGLNMTTDVLSFPVYANVKEIPDKGETLIGDIVINLPAAKRQAVTYGNSFRQEVQRLLVHGFLHLMGYDHEGNTYQRQKMVKREKELRDALKAVD